MDNKKKKSESEIDLRNYRDIDKITEKKLSFGLWFIKNRRYFFISLIVFLLFFPFLIYSYFFYNLFDYIRYTPEERKYIKELSEIRVNIPAGREALSLETKFSQNFFHNNGYDFIAKVKNPNSNFFANISYCFVDGEVELFCSSDNVFPGQEKFIVALSIKIESRLNKPSLVIKKVNWERLDTRKYPNWPEYYLDKNNFIISKEKFEIIKSTNVGISSTNSVSFDIKNNSPYNFWEVPLLVVLYYQGNIIGVNKYTVLEFMSLEEKHINLFWSNSINSVDKVEIIPDLNILDEDNYIKYK